jgi:hypothetical protein
VCARSLESPFVRRINCNSAGNIIEMSVTATAALTINQASNFMQREGPPFLLLRLCIGAGVRDGALLEKYTPRAEAAGNLIA